MILMLRTTVLIFKKFEFFKKDQKIMLCAMKRLLLTQEAKSDPGAFCAWIFWMVLQGMSGQAALIPNRYFAGTA